MSQHMSFFYCTYTTLDRFGTAQYGSVRYIMVTIYTLRIQHRVWVSMAKMESDWSSAKPMH